MLIRQWMAMNNSEKGRSVICWSWELVDLS
jgi:hypothetical protein